MEVIVSARVTREDNSKDNIVKVDNFRLRRPDIEISVSFLTLYMYVTISIYHLLLNVYCMCYSFEMILFVF